MHSIKAITLKKFLFITLSLQKTELYLYIISHFTSTVNDLSYFAFLSHML